MKRKTGKKYFSTVLVTPANKNAAVQSVFTGECLVDGGKKLVRSVHCEICSYSEHHFHS
jgi:hypothetical protein